MLKFIYGRSGCGKTDHIFSEITANVAAGVQSYLLVPDQFSMLCEKRLIDMLGLSVQNYATVLSFSRLTNRVLSEAGPLRMNYIDTAAKSMLIKRALDKSIGKLTVLRRAARLSGFSEVTQTIISEFKRYNITPEKLATARDNAKTPELADKLADLAAIFAEYEMLISNGYNDMEDNLSLAVERLNRCDFLCDSTVYIDNFKSFSALEYDVLGEILKSAANVVVSLTRDDSNDTIFASSNHTYQRLTDLAFELGIPIAPDIHLTNSAKFEKNPELAHLERNFFAQTPEIWLESTERIKLLNPQNHYNEIDQICRQIKALTAQHSYHYRDFCILYRDFENYDGIIPALFAKYEIPYFCDTPKSVMQNPLIRHAVSVMEILAYGFSYERVTAAMKSGFATATNMQLDKLENYILAADISYRLWRNDSDWKPIPDIPAEFMSDINAARTAVISPIMRLRGSIKGRKSASEISVAFLEYFKEMEIIAKLQSKMEQFTNDGKHGKIDEYTLAWKSLNSVIIQISQIFGDELMTYETYLSLLTSGLANLKTGVTPPTQDEVLITQIDRFRSHGAKVVLILGVNDGVLPKSFKTEGILSDSDRDELATLGIPLAETQERRQIEELNLIYNILTAASERLFVSVPLSQKDGKPLNESFIIGRLRGIFVGLTVGDGVLDVPQNNINTLQNTEKSNQRDVEDAVPYKISKKMAKLLYGEKLWLSISRVEKYNGCAFAYFLQYGLVAKPRATAEFKQHARGSLLHEVLARYFANIKRNDISYSSISKPECEREIREIARTAALEHHSAMMELSPSFGYFARRMENVASVTAWNIVKFYKQSKFRPFGFEISFRPSDYGKSFDYSSPEITVNNEPVGFLVGDIDRVDIATVDDKDYITIVDYKSATKRLDPRLVDEGVQIQPLAYANMMSQAIGAETAAMLYTPMSDPIIKWDENADIDEEISKSLKPDGWILDNEEVEFALDCNRDDKGKSGFIPSTKSRLFADLSTELDKANVAIQRAAEGMLDGNIAVKSRNIKGHDPCAWCDYARVCEQSPDDLP